MANSKKTIKREIFLTPELDKLIQAPLKDPALSLPKGIRGDFICGLIEENLGKWYELCYGEEFGLKALKFERLNQSEQPFIKLDDLE